MSKKLSSKKLTISEEQRDKEDLLSMKKADPTYLKENIYHLKQQLLALHSEKIDIETQMERSAEKFMRDSYEIEKTTKMQEEQLTQLQSQYLLLKKTFEEMKIKTRLDWENETQLLLIKKQQQKESVLATVGSLSKKIAHMKQFKVREKQYLQTIAKLQEKESGNKTAQERDIDKIRRENEQKREEINQATNSEIKNIKQSEVLKLESRLTRQQQIKQQNQIILDKISLCENQKRVLQEEFEQISADSLCQHGNNSDSLLGIQATETYERSLRVIKLENKLTKLKEQMQIETHKLDQELINLDKKYDENEKELVENLSKGEGWLKMKEKDLKRMKACAQMVLNQRNNLESYILEVFHEHPEIDYSVPANTSAILRLLFIKINSKKPPVTYKDYLAATNQSQSEISDSIVSSTKQ